MEASRTALGAATVFVTAGLLSFFLSPEELGVIVQDGHVHSDDEVYYHEDEDTDDYYYTTPEPVYSPESAAATPATYIPTYVPTSRPNTGKPSKPGRELQKLANQIDIPIDVLVIGLGIALSFGALALLYIVAKESEGVDEEAYFYNASVQGIDPYQLHLELGRLAVKDGQIMIVQGKQPLSLQQDDTKDETPINQAFNYKTEVPQQQASNKVARNYAQKGEGRNVDSLLGSLSSLGLSNQNPDTDYEDSGSDASSSAVPFYQKSGTAPHRIEELNQVITVRAVPSTFAGHTDVVTGVYTNPQMTELFSVSLDKSLRIWDKQTRQVLHTVANHHSGAINSMAVDGERVYTGGEDGLVHVWSWVNGSTVGKLAGHKGPVKAVQVDGQFVFTASSDLSVKVWDKNSLVEKMNLTHTEIKTPVNALYVTDQYIVAASGNSIFIWTKQGQPFYKWSAHHQDITSLVVLDGTIYTGSADSYVRVWNSRGQLVSSYTSGPQVISIDGDETFLYALYEDGSVRAWDRSNEGSFVNLAPAGSRIAGGTLFADQFNVYVASGNVVSAYNKPQLTQGLGSDDLRDLAMTKQTNTSKLLNQLTTPHVDVQSGNKFRGSAPSSKQLDPTLPVTLQSHTGNITAMTKIPGSTNLYSVGEDKSLITWDTVSFQLKSALACHEDSITCIHVDDDGIYTGSPDCTVHIIKPKSDTSDILTCNEPITALTGSPIALIGVSSNGTLTVWDKFNLTPKASFSCGGPVTSLAVSPDAIYVTLQSALRVYDTRGRFQRDLNHSSPIQALALWNEKICTGCQDGSVRVWNKSGDLQATYQAPSSVLSLDSATDRLFAGCAHQTVVSWDTAGHMTEYSQVKSTSSSGDVRSLVVDGLSHRVYAACDRDVITWVYQSDFTVSPPKQVSASQSSVGHTDEVICLYSEPTMGMIYSGSQDRSVKIWDRKSMSCLKTLSNHHSDTITAIHVVNNTIYTASEDLFVKGYSLDSNTIVRKFHAHDSWVLDLFVNEEYIYSAAYDGSVRVWDRVKKRLHRVCHVLTLLTLGKTNSDGSESQYVASLPGATQPVTRLWVASDKTVFAATGCTMLMWSNNHQLLNHLECSDVISCFVVDTKQNILYTGLYDHTVAVWKDPTSSNQKLQVLGGVPAPVTSIAQDSANIYASYSNGVIRAFQKSDNTFYDVVDNTGVGVNSLYTDDEDGSLYAGRGDATIVSYDKQAQSRYDPDEEPFDTITGHFDEVTCVYTFPGSDLVYTGAQDNTLKAWHSATLRCVFTLSTLHTAAITAITIYSKQASEIEREVVLYTASEDGTVAVYSLKDKMLLGHLRGHTGWVLALAVDDARVYTGSHDNTIRVWDRSTGTHLQTIQESAPVTAVVVTSGELIVSSGTEMKVYALNTFQLVRSWTAHKESITCVAVYQDQLITGSNDCNLGVWGLQGNQRAVLPMDSRVLSMAVDNSKKRLYAASASGSISVWSLPDFIHQVSHMSTGDSPGRSIAVDASHVFVTSNCLIKVWPNH